MKVWVRKREESEDEAIKVTLQQDADVSDLVQEVVKLFAFDDGPLLASQVALMSGRGKLLSNRDPVSAHAAHGSFAVVRKKARGGLASDGLLSPSSSRQAPVPRHTPPRIDSPAPAPTPHYFDRVDALRRQLPSMVLDSRTGVDYVRVLRLLGLPDPLDAVAALSDGTTAGAASPRLQASSALSDHQRAAAASPCVPVPPMVPLVPALPSFPEGPYHCATSPLRHPAHPGHVAFPPPPFAAQPPPPLLPLANPAVHYPPPVPVGAVDGPSTQAVHTAHNRPPHPVKSAHPFLLSPHSSIEPAFVSSTAATSYFAPPVATELHEAEVGSHSVVPSFHALSEVQKPPVTEGRSASPVVAAPPPSTSVVRPTTLSTEAPAWQPEDCESESAAASGNAAGRTQSGNSLGRQSGQPPTLTPMPTLSSLYIHPSSHQDSAAKTSLHQDEQQASPRVEIASIAASEATELAMQTLGELWNSVEVPGISPTIGAITERSTKCMPGMISTTALHLPATSQRERPSSSSHIPSTAKTPMQQTWDVVCVATPPQTLNNTLRSKLGSEPSGHGLALPP
eukprot:TRINITY_DN25653_c0_g1_i1.p1 TRINITY_DN25653_c0_g1~~TRINITY_DN25653_c0_g1_i1.p1  ORF type:complete len:566 (+),score=25.28 TRINITY_DN25653_c0_g1_i1:127-1824(+)